MTRGRSRGSPQATSSLLVSGLLLLLIAGGVVLLSPLLNGAHAAQEPINRTELEYQIHLEINEERTERGLEPLKFDNDLRPIARQYSKKMAINEFFAHTAPNGNTFRDRYQAAGYECRVTINSTHIARGGENLARTFYGQPVKTDRGVKRYQTQEALAEGIVAGWMNSTEHRENILKPHWEHEAIGVHITDAGQVYATQNFC